MQESKTTTYDMREEEEVYDGEGEELDNNKNPSQLVHTNIHDAIGAGCWHW